MGVGKISEKEHPKIIQVDPAGLKKTGLTLKDSCDP